MPDEPTNQAVFLDTTEFKAKHFAFDSNEALRGLFGLCAKGHTFLLTNQITDAEVEKNIGEHVHEGSESLKTVKRKWVGLKNEDENVFSFLGHEFESDGLKAKLYQHYLDYQLLCSGVEFNVYGVDLEKVMDSYFSIAPPFEDTKKKKHEFPDAIVLRSLKAWAEANQQTVFVVSNDVGFKKFSDCI